MMQSRIVRVFAPGGNSWPPVEASPLSLVQEMYLCFALFSLLHTQTLLPLCTWGSCVCMCLVPSPASRSQLRAKATCSSMGRHVCESLWLGSRLRSGRCNLFTAHSVMSNVLSSCYCCVLVLCADDLFFVLVCFALVPLCVP